MTSTDHASAPDDVRPGDGKRWWVLATVTVCLLVVIMGNTILNVALPALQRGLGAPQGELQWAACGTAAASAVALVVVLVWLQGRRPGVASVTL